MAWPVVVLSPHMGREIESDQVVVYERKKEEFRHSNTHK
jgi:hypothetical protein